MLDLLEMLVRALLYGAALGVGAWIGLALVGYATGAPRLYAGRESRSRG